MTIAKTVQFPSDLTDEQWKLLHPLIPSKNNRGRPVIDRRMIINAIFYVLKGGIQWRMLPDSFPKWKTVYHVFRKWTTDGTWEEIHDQLRTQVHAKVGKRSRPTAAILDSQSVKSNCHGGEVGYDAGKKVKGRKRHILVDTLGMLLGVFITPASTPEREGAQGLLERVLHKLPWLKMIWVDGGYSGETFANWVRFKKPCLGVEVVKRDEDTKGFNILKRRWIVERTFGWFMHQRRLVRDYEYSESSAKAWIYTAMIRIQLRRLA